MGVEAHFDMYHDLKNFALMSQIKIVKAVDSEPRLVYTEIVSKYIPGGLQHCKRSAKQVSHFANTSVPRDAVSACSKCTCLISHKDKY